ncbi:hypothetical protein L6019_RS23280 [Escherichia coli]|uniref:hypothetical protein n=1 Tax=Escherichia coli TaxID=562 RepID=UPI000A186357|nr:hypothetical protein [Escherichia coli]EFH8163198.1 hypothetical protein [Escherichia coli]EKG7113476.1 hypothetical protein [Escherichia coli]EKI3096577.1 hypothetical protein [Escherichia coli]EKR4920324.1 hypothetical protein [Escherichia coli]ELM8776571.1 hypothetical protein [Escherichia coli]
MKFGKVLLGLVLAMPAAGFAAQGFEVTCGEQRVLIYDNYSKVFAEYTNPEYVDGQMAKKDNVKSMQQRVKGQDWQRVDYTEPDMVGNAYYQYMLYIPATGNTAAPVLYKQRMSNKGGALEPQTGEACTAPSALSGPMPNVQSYNEMIQNAPTSAPGMIDEDDEEQPKKAPAGTPAGNAELFACGSKKITIYYDAKSIFMNNVKMDDTSIFRDWQKNEGFINFRVYSTSQPYFTHYQIVMTSDIIIATYQTYNNNGRKITAENHLACDAPVKTNAPMPNIQSVRESQGW